MGDDLFGCNDNWPRDTAFPTRKVCHSGHDHAITPGLTKREYFAGLAMQGIMTQLGVKNFPTQSGDFKLIVGASVRVADMLLAALAEKGATE